MAELIVALDFPTAAEALGMARGLAGRVRWMKIGLELFASAGPEVVREVRNLGCKVFLDLKFLDIPNTVAGAVRSAVACGADMLDVHVLGGAEMLRAALAARDAAARECGCPVLPRLLGVTVLTSLSAADSPLFRGRTPLQLVLELARAAAAAGLDGVVSSAREAAAVKEACGRGFLCLTPGIRLADAAAPDDQRRVATPAAAVAAGSDFLVVGRPITRAADPAAAAADFLRGMAGGTAAGRTAAGGAAAPDGGR